MQSNIQCDRLAPLAARTENPAMPKRGPYKTEPQKPPPLPPWRRNYLAKWREFRRMTQEELAEKASLSVGTVSSIENGDAGYSDASLYRLALALRTSPGMILEVDPLEDAPLWAIVSRADREQRARIAKHAGIILDEKPTRGRKT